jgi:predicted enzyme related to lactoylglutathione lyase
MKSLIQDIAFVLYPVADVAKARAFYAGVLGLAETANWQDQWIEYDLGNGTLAITGGQPGAQAGNGAMAAFEVKDFDAAAAFLKEKSIPWSMEPFESPVCRGACIKDPDGNQIMIHQRKAK